MATSAERYCNEEQKWWSQPASYSKLSPGGPIPHNLAKTFDGPPTLERSGSEHRVGRLHPRFLRKRGLGRKWSSLWLKGDGGIRKNPSLMGKSDANECNENSLSNCRVQLTLSTKKNGMILEERYSNEEPNITFFKILIGITTCNIVVTL